MQIVGIAGSSGAGKSTAAAAIVERGNFEVLSFAHPLKEMAIALLMSGFGYTRASCDVFLAEKKQVIPELNVSMRHLLQTLGTEWGRSMIRQDMWLESMADRIIDRGEHANIVIDDVRFEDEAAFIRWSGGLVIHLRRPMSVSDGHASEAGVSVGARDVVIDNTGSIVDLAAEVNHAVERFKFALDDEDKLLRLCLSPSRSYIA